MSSRKKKHEESMNGTATALAEPPLEAANQSEAPITTEPPPSDAPKTEPVNRPVKSFSVAGGSGTTIEGNVWPREIFVDGKPVTAFAATVRKTYCGDDGVSRHSTSFRGSEIPLLQYVLERCAEWMFDQRCIEEPAF